MTIQQLYKILLTACIATCIMSGISSCKKYNDWSVDDSHSRLFRPSEFTATVDGVTVTLKWKSKPGTNGYKVELSKDSLQFTTIVKTYTFTGVKDADGYIFTIPDLLDPSTQYSARIKGTDSAGTPESEWATVAFKTLTEQIMFTVAAADLTPFSVKLKWKVPNNVTHFMLGTVRYDISAGEQTAGEKTITGLTPNTAYSAVLYYNTAIRGSQNFSTPPDLPTGPNVVYVTATDDFPTMIQNAVSGTMFVLRQGSMYTTDNLVNLPNNASITIWGEVGANIPILAFNGFNLPTTAGTIKFENIDLTGYQAADPTKTKRNYIFNQSAANTTAEIIFENCILRNFVNTPMRMQGANAITIDKFTVNKCTVYDIGDNGANGTYAFINNNVATSKINNISITNSTFYKVGYALIVHNAAPSQTVVISNNTFNNVTGDGRIFIDYNAQTITTTFKFENNIMGKTLSPAGTAKGIRAATVPTVINSYRTTDNVFTGNAIPNITDHNKTSTELFTDPANGNFLIKDVGFPGKSSSGDPRWRL